jgi:hypothetical protein
MPNEKDEYLVYGTYEQIKAELVRLKNQQIQLKSLDVQSRGDERTSHEPIDTDHPLVILKFAGLIQDTNLRHNVQKSFRLINENPKTVPLERLQQIGRTIWAKFNNFTFMTGRTSYCYVDTERGMNFIWGYFHAQEDAQRVYEQMLDIQGFSPDWTRFTKKEKPFAGDEFADKPSKKMQAGVLIRPKRKRPIAKVTFKKAMLKFPDVEKAVPFVTEYGRVIENLDCLKPYMNR